MRTSTSFRKPGSSDCNVSFEYISGEPEVPKTREDREQQRRLENFHHRVVPDRQVDPNDEPAKEETEEPNQKAFNQPGIKPNAMPYEPNEQ